MDTLQYLYIFVVAACGGTGQNRKGQETINKSRGPFRVESIL